MTHKEIAKIAHVSVSTVSKALSDSREVSSETAERIKRIAIETGYFEEKNKRRIEYKKGKSAVVAVLCPEIISADYSRMVDEIKKAVESRGGRISAYIYDFSKDKLGAGINSIVLGNEADGIIVIGDGSFEKAPSIPTVQIGKCSSGIVDCVYSDGAAVTDTVVEYLMRLGHTKIGYVGEFLTMKKYSFFKESLKKHRLPFCEDWCHTIDKRFEEVGYEAAERIYKSQNRPTAFVCAYDEVALALIYGLTNRGISVPEDISVVGVNDIPFSAYAAKPLTTVRMFYEKQCRMSVDILYDKIFGSSKEAQSIIVEHELVIRKTSDRAKE
ncbi:MAG: LacI family DNA-binding transcriptional regulator [Clostridiales bacterium]|nr:LacI family DNA-binding transcriptional regulator [Clostridiales bacterium]